MLAMNLTYTQIWPDWPLVQKKETLRDNNIGWFELYGHNRIDRALKTF